MPIGSSSGQYFQDEGDLLVGQYGPMTDKQKSDRKEIDANTTSGDFRSRFGGAEERPLVYIGMPLGSGTEATGALKSSGGTNVPENTSTQELPDIDDVLKAQDNASKPTPNTIISGTNSTTGRPINITDQDLDQGMGLAMSFSGGGLTFAGVNAATMPSKLANLGHAQILEQNGYHPDTIWQETGFGRGADGKWRHEIDDSKASFDQAWSDDIQPHFDQSKANVISSKPLGDILDHPELYKAYPDLKKMPVVFDKDLQGIAHYDPNSDSIHMGLRAVEHKNQQGILMHEVQHAIQEREGFAKGGAPGQAGYSYELKYAGDVRKLLPEAFDLLEKREAGTASDAELERLAWINKVGKTYTRYKEAGDRLAYENYMRLAGEAEARNTDARLLLTDAERRSMHPRWTEDLGSENQIVVNDPVTTTPYGVWDPKTGKKVAAPNEPTQFRRAANDNTPQTWETKRERMKDILNELRGMNSKTLRFTPEQQSRWEMLNKEHSRLFDELMKE